MKREDFFDLFCGIDEEKVLSAENLKPMKKRNVWLKLSASAAVLVAVFTLAVSTLPEEDSDNPPVIDATDGSNIGEYSGPVTEEKMNGAFEESGRWMYASDVTESDSGVHGVAIPSFIAYDGALYGSADFEAMSGEYLATNGKVMFNSKYEFNAYEVKGNENLVGIVINGGVMVYDRLYSFMFNLDDEIYGLNYKVNVGAEYSLGEKVLENDDFTVYRAIPIQTDEQIADLYIVDISKYLIRNLPEIFNENENFGEFWWIATPIEENGELASDAEGVYYEAVTLDNLKDELKSVFGGSYVDNSGKLNIVLTSDTDENREAVLRELGISESVVVFVKGKYTLEYLTELQEKISKAMTNGELPFVVSSGIYETTNRIVAGVTDNNDDNINKLMALDEMGGAILVEAAERAFTQELIKPSVE